MLYVETIPKQTLPYVKGTRATALCNVAPVDLARKVYAPIQYDHTSSIKKIPVIFPFIFFIGIVYN